jgi:hypothetical protein
MREVTVMTVILDANVLYPAPVRDLLLHLADLNLFKPKWTVEIQDEWIRNLLLNRPDLKETSLISAQKPMVLSLLTVKIFHRNMLTGLA